MTDPHAMLAEHWPTSGPHTRATVCSAAEVAAGLTRYLAHATGPADTRTTLPGASDVDRVIASLEAATTQLPLLIEQLTERVTDLAADGGLYDNRNSSDRQLAVDTSEELSGLLGDVRVAAFNLAQLLGLAHVCSGRLGDNPPIVDRGADVLQRFVRERCTTNETDTASARDLLLAFKDWANDNNEPMPTVREFGLRLRNLVAVRRGRDGQYMAVGLGLTAQGGDK
jgi:hypothetical protein